MIRFERTIQAAIGKGRAALAWAQEVTAYINGRSMETKFLVFTQRFGDINQISWQADFETLASLDNYQQTLNGDQGYWALVDKAEGLFVEGSINDTVLQSL
jgi:hypothetical protein